MNEINLFCFSWACTIALPGSGSLALVGWKGRLKKRTRLLTKQTKPDPGQTLDLANRSLASGLGYLLVSAVL